MSPARPTLAFPSAAEKMALRDYLGPARPVEPTDYFVIMEFSGNGFTFEIRRRDKFSQKSDDINRIKISLPNSEDIRTRPNKDIRPSSIEQIRRQLHYIKGVLNDLKHRGNNLYVKAIGTAAMRDASNAQAIQDMISSEIGDQIQFEIVEGEIEAALSAYGLTLFYPEASGLIVDMGGGSTEFSVLKNGKLKKAKSQPIGTGSIKAAEDPKEFVKSAIKGLPKSYRKIETLFLSGGTFRNINKAFCEERGLDIKAPTPPQVTLQAYKAYIKKLLAMDDAGWRAMPDNLKDRREFLEQALSVVKRLCKEFPKNTKVALTKTKTRDGLFHLMHDMLEQPDVHLSASVNTAFAQPSPAAA